MAPNLLGSTTLLLAEVNQEPVKIKDTKPLVKSISTASPQAATHTASQASSKKKDDEYEWKIVWRNVLGFIYLHIGAVYGLYLFFVHARWLTLLFGVLYGMVAALGVTAGAHRLWAHRSYKATWQLRLILIILQTICFQNHIYEWVRDHRVHHKFTDSDADPHNSKRGFFFSHMGWLMIKKHKDVKEKGRIVDLSDLEKDPLVIWQRRLYLILMPVFCFVIPTLIPWYYWNEDLYTAWYVCAIFRYVLSLHFTWLVNSAAHIYGNRPYDETISPTENKLVGSLAFGEGWHNYHHVFPWDYKAAELPTYGRNFTLGFINQMAKIGWAYDLKTVTPEMIQKRAKRSGDGSHPSVVTANEVHDHEDQLWGWGDKDLKEEHVKMCKILHRKSQ